MSARTVVIERDKHLTYRWIDPKRSPGRGRNGSYRWRIRDVPESWPSARLIQIVKSRFVPDDVHFDDLIIHYARYPDRRLYRHLYGQDFYSGKVKHHRGDQE